MSVAISDYLALAKTPEEREEMKQRILDGLLRFDDSYIDYSDIPEITDFSRFRPAKPHFDKIREHNRYVREMRKKLAD